MVSPTFEDKGAFYLFHWQELDVYAKVNRIHEDSKFNVTGEVTMWTKTPGVQGHLKQDRLNMTSAVAKRNFSQALNDQWDLPPWRDMVEQLAVKTLDYYRQGEPPKLLADVEPSDALRYALEPFILSKQANLFFGDGSSAKSMLAVWFSVMIDQGWSHLGHIAEPGKVLYLDWEADENDIAERVRAVQAGMGIDDKSGIMYRYCDQPLPAMIDRVMEWAAESSINTVIVDSAGPACGGNPSEPDATLRFFGALRKLRCTTITIGHQPKALSGTDVKEPFGSVYWRNMARSVYQVKKVQEEEQERLEVGLFHRKINTGRLRRSSGFAMQFENVGERLAKVTLEDVAVKDIPDFRDSLPKWLQVQQLLKENGAMDVKDVARAVHSSEQAIRNLWAKKPDLFTHGGQRPQMIMLRSFAEQVDGRGGK